jgi:hypothetical protein
MPAGYYFDERTAQWGASRIAEGFLHAADPQTIVSRRRRNYTALYQRLAGVAGITPLFDSLPSAVCPLGLPVLVENRRSWYEAMYKAGIGVFPWWEGYHHGLSWDEFPDACYLKDHVLLLPVHQDLDVDHMNYVADMMMHYSRNLTLKELPKNMPKFLARPDSREAVPIAKSAKRQ